MGLEQIVEVAGPVFTFVVTSLTSVMQDYILPERKSKVQKLMVEYEKGNLKQYPDIWNVNGFFDDSRREEYWSS